METVVASILLDVAAKVGAPLVKGLLEKIGLGGAASDIAGTVIDSVAEKLGVSPSEIPNQPAGNVEAAVKATEAETPELVMAWAKQQELSNQLQLAEMNKAGEPTWTWAWRPAWMWFLGFLFLFRLVLVPIADAALGSNVAATVDLGTMMTLTTWFMALYMGGHTVKDAITKWAGK
ncbi:hypothetical protein [Mesorhizobium sp.]|uniref:hypothetical protein n=1 Tax=Mesorhizobium sp. TaxID=1871066 RepID=UPI000FE46EC7|nr:hypothetical protein [Mesorhizobium sp.]RWC58904.1 MAG: hypothetical protein EOS56_18520 [Mesorhizobium sp.]RWC66516.1 MAG: hypothetical protein EOS29_03875 [Mesorhizobium sp.]